MKAVKGPKGRAGAQAKRTPSFSTSQGRAHFAQALETTDREKTVVGFARYNRTVAALVPVEAICMLAGEDGEVDPGVRAKIARMARLFVSSMPKRSGRPAAAKAKPSKAKKKAPAKRGKAKAKKAKTKAAKRKPLGKSA